MVHFCGLEHCSNAKLGQMSLHKVISEIATKLDGWRMNEAQTRQVILLRILQALGWDIWNPDEVSAEKNSGGGGGAYVPDFTIVLGGDNKYILEAKALGKEFTENDKAQAVNYAGAIGLRWAVLSNGVTWQFYDNSLYSRPAAERLAVTVDIRDSEAGNYLSQLLSREVWSQPNSGEAVAKVASDIQEDIRKRQSLSQIERKLREVVGQVYVKTEVGLSRAIETELDANERELATAHFRELCGLLLESPYSPNEMDVINALRSGILYASQTGDRSSGLRVWLQGQECEAKSWRDLHVGVAEAFIRLGRSKELEDVDDIHGSVEERKKRSGETYPDRAYRKLSSGRFIFVRYNADAHRQRTQELLRRLNLPSGLLEVEYKDQKYKLP
jgi:hypothetical protein